MDTSGNVVASYQSSGVNVGNIANGINTVAPGIIVPPGDYLIKVSDPMAVSYDAQGVPDFYVKAVPAEPEIYDFTGTYIINVDVVKTSTIFGPVNEGKSSFNLNQFELTVLDKGEEIELIGKYEGMPFSQGCPVTEREENKVTAMLQFALDLTNLPYKAKVGADAVITLENIGGLVPKISINGNATYQRVSKEKGNDFNTYSVTGGGNMSRKELPAYVVAALGNSIGSVGNVPGPKSKAQAAAGMLFPPLAGLVAHVIQELIKAKEEKEKEKHRELSVGEKAMADANQSLGKGLYDEREAKAWAIMAEALANSDNPDDDPFSVGDNEKPGGADYIPQNDNSSYDQDYDSNYEESSPWEGEQDYSYEDDNQLEEPVVNQQETEDASQIFVSEKEQLQAERDEWLQNLKSSMESADPDDPTTKELHSEYENYIDYLNNKINDLNRVEKEYNQKTITVQVDHTGRTAEISYDEETGKWHNTESGNEFNMETYQKDVLPNFEKDRAFIEEQREKMQTKDKYIEQFFEDQNKRQQIFDQLQKWRKKSYGIEPPAEGVGDVKANIDKLMNDINNMDIPVADLEDKAKRIGKVVIDRTTGKTMDEDRARSYVKNILGVKEAVDRGEGYISSAKGCLTDLWNDATNIHIIADTVNESNMDIITGRTWAGMAGRAGLAVLTGGASEYVLSPIEALVDIKQSMDSGETEGRATLKAIGKYVLGELGGEYLGAAWKKSGYHINPDFVKRFNEVGDTPITKLLTGGAKSGSKEAFENVTSTAGKKVLSSSDNAITKNAKEMMEYSKYRTKVNNQASMIEGKVRGGEPLTKEDLRKVLKDPSISRELKKSHGSIQDTYQDTLEKTIYNPAKEGTSSRLEKGMLEDVQKEFGPDAKVKVEVESIRTPGANSPRINADNDVTGKITITDSSGRTITREIPADKVSKIYNEEFAKSAGMIKDGKFDVAKAQAEMPEGVTIKGPDGKPQTISWEKATKEQQLEAFASKHNQEVTDVNAAQASIDFNASRNASGVSNVAQLKSGVSTARLEDAGGLAKMEQYKIDDFFNKGGMANQTEAYEQLAKMGKLTNDLTNAYNKLGYKTAGIPSNMKKAIEISGNRNLSPRARAAELQKLGFDGPKELANKMSARIEGLEKMKKSMPPKSTKTVEKVTAAIIKSYLHEENK